MIKRKLSHQAYLDTPDYLSASVIKTYHTTKSMRAAMHKGTFKSTPAMDLGTGVHALVLEGEKAFKDLLYTKIDRRTKEGKAQAPKAPHQIELSDEKIQQAHDMAGSVDEYVANYAPELKPIFKGGEAELSVFNEICGLPFKSRFDSCITDCKIILELKTIADIKKYESQSWDFGYPLAEYLYRSQLGLELGVPASDISFVYLFVSSQAPYDVLHCQSTQEVFRQSSVDFMACVEAFTKHKETGKTPGFMYGERPQLDVPAWMKRRVAY